VNRTFKVISDQVISKQWKALSVFLPSTDHK